MLDDADVDIQRGSQTHRIIDGSEVAIEDVVPFIRNEGRVALHPADRLAPEHLELAKDILPSESDDFDGQREAAKPLDPQEAPLPRP
jgi:hypothetical protein